MNEPLIDFDFLREISGNDPEYIAEVIQIFMDSAPQGIEKLEELIHNGTNWDAVSRQAHSLKSSVSVIKIRGIYDQLADIEAITRQKHALPDSEREKITDLLKSLLTTFGEARPLLLREIEKHKTNGE